MGRFRGRLTCRSLVCPSCTPILSDLVESLGKSVQTTLLLFEATSKLLRDRCNTLIDLAQVTGHRFVHLIDMSCRLFARLLFEAYPLAQSCQYLMLLL